MGKVIAIVNPKGGVGKSTTAINLSASLAKLGKKTLLIDVDAKGNATLGSGLNPHAEQSNICDCISKGIDPTEAILKTKIDNFDVLPSCDDLENFELAMAKLSDRETLLKKVVIKIKDAYDFIIIDCPPSLKLMTINALTASDSVLIPMRSDFFAISSLGGLLNTIKIIQNKLNPELNIEGFVITMFKPTERLSMTAVEEVKKNFQTMVMNTMIEQDNKLGLATMEHQPIIIYDPASVGSKEHIELAKEIISNN